MKPTYSPNKKKRLKKIGFLKRMSSPSGRNILKRKRRKKKYKLVNI